MGKACRCGLALTPRPVGERGRGRASAEREKRATASGGAEYPKGSRERKQQLPSRNPYHTLFTHVTMSPRWTKPARA